MVSFVFALRFVHLIFSICAILLLQIFENFSCLFTIFISNSNGQKRSSLAGYLIKLDLKASIESSLLLTKLYVYLFLWIRFTLKKKKFNYLSKSIFLFTYFYYYFIIKNKINCCPFCIKFAFH